MKVDIQDTINGTREPNESVFDKIIRFRKVLPGLICKFLSYVYSPRAIHLCIGFDRSMVSESPLSFLSLCLIGHSVPHFDMDQLIEKDDQ